MSAVAWKDWPEAFQEAGKLNSSDPAGDQRLTFTLDAAAYAKALRSLDNEHGWLQKTDPRYQQACFTGRLEWWDERGRCVVLIREGGQWDRMDRAQMAVSARLDEQNAKDRSLVAGLTLGQRSLTEMQGAPPSSVTVTISDAPPIIPTPISERENPDIKPPLLSPESKAVFAEDTARRVEMEKHRPTLAEALKPKGKKK